MHFSIRRTTILFVVSLLAGIAGACSASPDSDQVVVHEWDQYSEDGDPWVGLVWEQSADGEVVFLVEATAPRGLEPGTPMGYYVHDELELSGFRGLFVVADAPDPELATIEMVWTSGLGTDNSRELDAALERVATQDTEFHLDCRTTDTNHRAVAIVDGELTPIKAWKILDDVKFVDVLPVHVECTPSVNE